MSLWNKDTKGEEMEKDEQLEGVEAAWAINLKRMVAQELNVDVERQAQLTRMVEDSRNLQNRINEIAMQSLQAFTSTMDDRQKDVGLARERHEKKLEERMEELEETMTRQADTINESIAGILSILEASGVLGASQQTSGKTGP